MKVYLAGGFRSNWQQQIEKSFPKNQGIIFFNPREHGLDKSDEYYFWDTLHLEQCDVVFAYLEESNPLALGLIFELGYARGLHKKIILVDEKSNKNTDYAKQFRFARESVDVVFESLDEGIKFLRSFNQ
ncbi:MAG: nucleoside 2-deoxyribosyltransferase domain-containing protein [Balneolaceae bacterium]